MVKQLRHKKKCTNVNRFFFANSVVNRSLSGNSIQKIYFDKRNIRYEIANGENVKLKKQKTGKMFRKLCTNVFVELSTKTMRTFQ